MMNISFKLFKVSAAVVLILILGQIPVQGKSISDHIGGALRGSFVQTKLHWISSRVDFTNGYKPLAEQEKNKGAGKKAHSPSEPKQSESGFLSGILKKLN